jgi:hypothetical protein
MTTTSNDTAEYAETETKTEPRTFMVWEMTALYRKLGLAAQVADMAAIADLRMFASNSVQHQCQEAA